MLVKIRTAFVLALALTLVPAFAVSHTIDVPGPSLVLLETDAGAVSLPAGALQGVVLEASPSHLVLAVAEPGVLIVDAAAGAEIVTTLTRVRLLEHELGLPSGVHGVATSFYSAVGTKEEDHDIDPDPKGAAGRPLVTLLTLDEAVTTKEEDHDIDPDPKRGPTWGGDWALASAAVAELGPGWYFVVRGGEVFYEVVVEGR